MKVSPWKQRRRWLMGHLPGEIGLRYRTKYRHALLHDAADRFEEALQQVAGTVCVDLGANLGVYTRKLAAVASRVHAFEPDPWTVGKLRENLADLDNVEIHAAAAGTSAGTVELYRHREFDPESGANSESSSLLATKSNVDPDNALRVPLVDIVAFLTDLDAPIGIVKMDIEGAEVEVLEALFDAPVLKRIGYIFCETHERRLPELVARTDALHRRAARMRAPVVDLFWH